MCKSKSVLVHLLDLTDNTQAHRNSDTGIKNHCCVIFSLLAFHPAPQKVASSSICSPPSLFSPSLRSPQSAAPAVQAVGAVCHAASSVGGAPFQPPREHRPARFHNFCEHDAGRYWTSENTSAAERALQHPPCWKTDTQIFELLRRSEPKGRDGRNSTTKKTTAQKDICVPLTVSCILFGQTLTSPVPQGSPPSRASRHL